MKRRPRRCACPCKKGAPKSTCGLKGLRRGIACPCPGQKLGGLRGTVAEHRIRAQKLIGEARRELTHGDCLTALSTAAQAEAEASWLPGGFRRGTVAHTASQLGAQALRCVNSR